MESLALKLPVKLLKCKSRVDIESLAMLLYRTFRKICKVTLKYIVIVTSHAGFRVQSQHELVALRVDNLFGDVEVG